MPQQPTEGQPAKVSVMAAAVRFASRKVLVRYQLQKKGRANPISIETAAHVRDMAIMYGNVRLLITPYCGRGTVWVDAERCTPIDDFDKWVITNADPLAHDLAGKLAKCE